MRERPTDWRSPGPRRASHLVSVGTAPGIRPLSSLPGDCHAPRRPHQGRTADRLLVRADDRRRLSGGQGSRRGYIVIAPEWAGRTKNATHLPRGSICRADSLRDACKRFSIDTDQVFLTGHAAGGTAAWDIALAHPDYWAGVIPIDARREKYIEHYTENAALLPFYFVNGELDLDKMTYNAMVWDRYFNKSKPNAFNVTVVEYLGRGNENFPDEIQRMFDWMGRMHRNFFPKEFSVVTMRPGTSISGGSN